MLRDVYGEERTDAGTVESREGSAEKGGSQVSNERGQEWEETKRDGVRTQSASSRRSE